MNRLSTVVALIIGVNLLVAGVLHGWGYDFLDRYVYQQKELLYKQALEDSRETFKDVDSKDWNTLSDELGLFFGTGSLIHSVDSKDLPVKVLDYISDTIGKDGIVDPFDPYVYYPLGKTHVFVLGPLSLDGFHLYIIEWVTLLSAMGASLFIVILYLHQFNRHTDRIYDKLLVLLEQVDLNTSKQSKIVRLYNLIDQIDVQYQQQARNNENHIQSQRDLLHGVAHEFRSPMARMQFAVEMLKDVDRYDKEQMLLKLDSGIAELDDLVKELLSYSRIKHLNQRLELESVAISQMIEESIDKVASFYPNVDFIYQGEHDGKVNVDERLILRALANILRNAGRFSHKLCQISVEQNEDAFMIVIEDDGDGIPPGKRERIFEPFTRLDASRSRDSGGSGLGLAIVQSIVEQHQGSISVDDSEQLGGACFHLTIPR